MVITKTELEFCTECEKENPQDREICDCGSRNFIFGNKFTYENKRLRCSCGCNEFKKVAHINMSPIFNTTYKCTNCGNPIGVQTYCES